MRGRYISVTGAIGLALGLLFPPSFALAQEDDDPHTPGIVHYCIHDVCMCYAVVNCGDPCSGCHMTTVVPRNGKPVQKGKTGSRPLTVLDVSGYLTESARGKPIPLKKFRLSSSPEDGTARHSTATKKDSK